MSAKHTSGPWRWEHGNASTDDVHCIDILRTNKHFKTIAYLQSYKTYDYDDRKETLANARLIAAAPDLLAALERLLAAAGEGDARGRAIDLIPEAIEKQAYAAIASATEGDDAA